jgi:Na+/melibiose symporter-like transporter
MSAHLPAVPAPAPRLSLRVLWLFALPNMALAIMHIPASMILPAFYAKSTQISLTAIGTVLLVGRLLDAVIDPALGFLSDRTRSPLGRRKPWVLAGLPLASIAVVYLFVPPSDAGTAYYLTWSLLLMVGWSIIEIPYAAWATELSHDYNQRSRIMTVRGTLGFVGGLLFMASPLLLSPWTGDTQIGGDVLRITSWVVALALPLLMVVTVVSVPASTEVAVRATTGSSLWTALRVNKPLRFYAVVLLANGVAAGAWGATVLLFVDSLGLGSQFPLLLLTAWGTRVAVAPLWLKPLYRFGKHRVWAFGALMSSLITPLALLVPSGPLALPLMLAYAFVLGFVETAWMVAPTAVYGDVIDYDTLKTGANQAGTYFALNGLIAKLASAVGGGIAFWILGLMDYSVKGDNNDTQRFGLFLSFALVPSLIYFATSLAVRRFPIDARRHGIIRRRIESRASRAARVASA